MGPLAVALSSWVTLTAAVAAPCEGPDADPWVADFRERVESYSDLYRLAVDQLGPRTSCEGEVTTEFDGALYGRLVLGFSEGATLTVETMPIETSVTVLRSPAGFDDADAVRAALAAYTEGIGLAIDWSAPEVTTEDDEVVRTFWDADSGLNASAALVFAGESLVAVRVSMAL